MDKAEKNIATSVLSQLGWCTHTSQTIVAYFKKKGEGGVGKVSTRDAKYTIKRGKKTSSSCMCKHPNQQHEHSKQQQQDTISSQQ